LKQELINLRVEK